MEELLALAHDLPRRALTPREVLVTDGDEPTAALYVLLEGTLRVEKRGVAIATFTEPGVCVGEMSLLLDIPSTADVIANDHAVVAVVDDAAARVENDPGLAIVLARLLATRLHVMTGYLVDIKEQYGDHEGGLGMVDTVLGSLMRGAGARSELGSDRDPDPEY